MSRTVHPCDPEIARIPVAECGDPLVDVRGIAALRLDPRLADPCGSSAMLRCEVANRLVTAQTLLPSGLRLLITGGHRPMALQRSYFDAHVERLRVARPDRDEAWLRARASRDVSPPEVASHVAGAAADVTLCTAQGARLRLDTDAHDTDAESGDTCSADVSPEARSNRAILVGALQGAGLVNYPPEWWHWSYGDRYWAYVTGAPAARYGPVAGRSAAHPAQAEA